MEEPKKRINMKSKHFDELTKIEILTLLRCVKADLMGYLTQLRKQRILFAESPSSNDDKKFFIANSFMVSRSLGKTLEDLFIFHDCFFNEEIQEKILQGIKIDEQMADKFEMESEGSINLKE